MECPIFHPGVEWILGAGTEAESKRTASGGVKYTKENKNKDFPNEQGKYYIFENKKKIWRNWSNQKNEKFHRIWIQIS